MLQCALEAQTAPQTQKAPSSKTYKPSSSNLTHVASCPKFSESPEEGVYYNVADVSTPPTPLLFVAVGLTKAGQQAYKNNLFKDPNDVVSRISVAVDAKGVPHNACLARSAGFDLDDQAADAALQYRFNPARKEGKAVTMRVLIEIRYQTH